MQQFDDKGHPTSKATDLHNKRLRRAQNEVLKLAGVVRSKNEETRPDQWKLMDDEERKKVVNEENEIIRFIRLFDDFTLDLIKIPIYAFRYRLMVGGALYTLPCLLTIARLSDPTWDRLRSRYFSPRRGHLGSGRAYFPDCLSQYVLV